jgi:hypothetical protein
MTIYYPNKDNTGRGGEVHMSQGDDRERKKYRIDIGAYGSIGIEAPTKEECLELFKEVTRTRRDSKIDEAIR